MSYLLKITFILFLVLAAQLAFGEATCPDITLEGISDEEEAAAIKEKAQEACQDRYGDDACAYFVTKEGGRYSLICGPKMEQGQ